MISSAKPKLASCSTKRKRSPRQRHCLQAVTVRPFGFLFSYCFNVIAFTLTSFPISAVTLGGIIAASVAVALLLLLLFCLWRRRRKRRRKKAGDRENGGFLLASHDIGSREGVSFYPSAPIAVVLTRDEKSSANHSNDSPRSNLNDAPLITQPSSKAAVPLSLPTLPISQVSGGNNGRARSLPRPPPLLPPPVLHPEREARRGDSFPVARAATTRPVGSSDRVSFLPNPWDSGAKPSAAAFERVIFGLPSSAPVVRPANSFRAGLPRTPRERQTFLPPELRPQFTVAVDRTWSNSGRRLGPAPTWMGG